MTLSHSTLEPTLHQRRIMIAIATGRGICVFPPCVTELIGEIGIEVFVTINGQYNEYQGKTLTHFPLHHGQIIRTTGHLNAQHIAYGYMTRDEIITFSQDRHMIQTLTSLHIPYRMADEFDINIPVYQMLAFYENNQNIDLARHLDDDLKTVRWHLSGVDILDAARRFWCCLKYDFDVLDTACHQYQRI